MTTALDIIKQGFSLVGITGSGETMTAEQAQDGLDVLNSTLDFWQSEALMVYAQTLDLVPFTQGQTQQTIGPGGAFVTARPNDVMSAYISYLGNDTPVKVISSIEYENIAVKTSQGTPSFLYVKEGFPNSTLYLWPVPSQAMTLRLNSNKQLRAFATIADTVSLAPGYARALGYAIACDLALYYGAPLPANVERRAAYYKRSLKNRNAIVPLLNMPLAYTGLKGMFL